MKRLVCSSLLASLLVTTSWADEVTMKNGDRVSGTILVQDGKTISIKSDNFGVITAPWSDVVSITAAAPINVVLQNGKALVGPVTPSDGKLVVTTSAGKVEVNPGEIAAIRNAEEQQDYERLLNPGWLDLWFGAASVAWAGANGNAKSLSFSSAFNATRLTNTDKTFLHFNLIHSSALVNGESATTAQAVRGGIGYDHNLTPRFFVNVFNEYEYDKFQNLDLRFVIGGGFGFHAIKTDRSALDLLAGIDYSRSTFTVPPTRNSAEAFWGDEYTYKLSGSTSLTQSYRMFNDLTNTGDFRVNFDIGLATNLTKWISWNLALSDRYLSNPLPGRKTNDWLYSTGLGITFGREAGVSATK